MTLSKSRFVAGLQCHKLLWWKTHEPSAPELLPSLEAEARFEEAAEVERRALESFPEGLAIEGETFEERVGATREALASGAPVLFGPAFSTGGLTAAPDVLDRRGGIRLIEIKSSTKTKPEHELDAAFQAEVLGRAGMAPARIEVLHLNGRYVHPGPAPLFASDDLTEEVIGRRTDLTGEIEVQRRVLEGPLPEAAIGKHCFSPYPCPFLARCWPATPHHVSTLYRGRPRIQELMAKGYTTLGDIPDDYPLDPVQTRQRRAAITGEVVVDPGLREALAALKPPLAFLDFETVAPAIPVWDGCRPYEQVAVQFSCHVEDGRGGHLHHEWIARDGRDARRELAERVLDACRGAGTVLAYWSPFEVGRLQHVAGLHPDLAAAIEDLASRVVDLFAVVRDHVFHPAFGSSLSLKSVLPALVPELSYDALPIAGGLQATVALKRLLFESPSAEEDARLRAELLRYCALDTWATVRLVERLRALALWPAPTPA